MIFLKKMYIPRAVYRISRHRGIFTILNRSKCSERNVIKSKAPDIIIPNQLIHEYVWEGLEKWYDKTAVICFDTGKNYTFSEIYTKSRNLAAILKEKFQLKKGDTVALILPNVPDFPVAFLGAIQAGLVVTTVNPYYTSDEMSYQLKDSETKLIFTICPLLPVINECTNVLKNKIPTIVAELHTADNIPANCVKLSELCDNNNNTPSILDTISPDEIAVLPYSSGTTGLSKGVQLTHRNVVSNLYQMSSPNFKANLPTEGQFQDVIPVFLPLFHIYGMVGIFLNFFAQGCKLITVSNFVGSQFSKLLQQYQPTLLFAVPAIIVIILNNPKIKYENLRTIRSIISAAAPLGSTAAEQFHEKCQDKVNLLQMYGMTETSPLTLMQTTKLKNGVKIGGSGFLIPNTQSKVISTKTGSNTGLGPYQSGELLVKGPQIMKGYHNNPLATDDAMLENKWLRTGDICYFDKDEHFFITDRLKELIKVKGFQVAPAELEDVLKSHWSVVDAAVVGVPHPLQGEVPKAFVVLKNDSNVKPERLKEFVASKVANYKRLVGGVVIMEKIPRNVAGKILRRDLKEL